MNNEDFTINAYNEKATEISAKFRSIGARIEDINRAIDLLDEKSHIKVVELGSGDGRDAAEIIKQVEEYIGVEPSQGLLEIARNSLPDTQFILATAQEYVFEDKVDIVFAFASLLHVNKDDLKSTFDKIYENLKNSGIIYLSLKESSGYEEVITNDMWGKRQFYYYSEQDILDIAGKKFKSVYIDHQVKSDTKWLTIALKKIN